MTNIQDEDRFVRSMFARVEIDHSTGCWNWIGVKTDQGYGKYKRLGKTKVAHRFFYEFYKGSLGSLFGCHHCDNKACCNPAHIFAGTNKDNQLDSLKKHKFPAVGEGCHLTKLTEAAVLAIRADKINSHASLGRRYGVAGEHISRIRRYKCWRWL